MNSQPAPLTANDLAHIEHRAQRWSHAVGTVYHELARDIARLLMERQRLLSEIASLEDGSGCCLKRHG